MLIYKLVTHDCMTKYCWQLSEPVVHVIKTVGSTRDQYCEEPTVCKLLIISNLTLGLWFMTLWRFLSWEVSRAGKIWNPLAGVVNGTSKKIGSQNILAGPRNLESVFQVSFLHGLFLLFFESRKLFTKDFRRRFLTNYRTLASRRVSDLTMRHPFLASKFQFLLTPTKMLLVNLAASLKIRVQMQTKYASWIPN